MKKMFVIIMLLFVSIGTFAQSTKETVIPISDSIVKPTGFGVLQLGKHISNYPQLSKSLIINNNHDYIMKVYKNSYDDLIYKLVSDTTDEYCTFGSSDKRVSVYYIPNIYVTDKIKLEYVTLKFFNDTLYYINVDQHLMEELTLKYGKGKTIKETVDKTFQNGYGAKFIKTNIRYYSEWRTNNGTALSTLFYSYYNSKGEPNIIEYTLLYLKKTQKKVEIEEARMIDEIKKRKESEKLNTVKDF